MAEVPEVLRRVALADAREELPRQIATTRSTSAVKSPVGTTSERHDGHALATTFRNSIHLAFDLENHLEPEARPWHAPVLAAWLGSLGRQALRVLGGPVDGRRCRRDGARILRSR